MIIMNWRTDDLPEPFSPINSMFKCWMREEPMEYLLRLESKVALIVDE
jgi:hypothetical protein